MEEEGLYCNDSALDSTRKHDEEDFGEIFCQGIHVLAYVVFQ